MNELKDIVLQLAEWVGDVAPELWAIMLRQALVQGWQSLFGATLSLVLLIVCIKGLVRSWDSEDLDDVLCIFLVLGVPLSGVIFIACALAAIGRLVNPSYYALLNIVNMFK